MVVAAASLLAGVSAATTAAGPAAAVPVAPTQELATLTTPHAVLARPERGGRRLGILAPRRPLTEEPTVLPVVGRHVDASGSRWLRVRLPGRPNGRTGWIAAGGTKASQTPWHIVVDVSARRTTVLRSGRAVREIAAIVGKPSTPTPRGRFFVEEVILLRAGDAGAPFALALSARSTVLQEFAGGPGQIALHGLGNVGGTLGTAVSHGCVRLDNEVMRWLVLRIAPGTPVTITA